MEIALYRPEIPPNTGNIARLSWCTGSALHIVGRPSFSLDEASVRRAGIDYWDQVDVRTHADWDAFVESLGEKGLARVALFTRFASRLYTRHEYASNDILVFGRETSGLPESIVEAVGRRYPERILRLPVFEKCRSLNLANAVAVAVYEGLRQLDFPGLRDEV